MSRQKVERPNLVKVMIPLFWIRIDFKCIVRVFTLAHSELEETALYCLYAMEGVVIKAFVQCVFMVLG